MNAKKIGLLVTMCTVFASVCVAIGVLTSKSNSKTCFDYFKRVSLKKCNINLSDDSFGWTGNSITPSVKISFENKSLKKDVDYTIKYKNNEDAGTATVILEGIGNYRGTVKKDFSIDGIDIAKDCTYSFDESTKTFTIYKDDEIVDPKNYTVKPSVKYYEEEIYAGDLIEYDKVTTYKISGVGKYSDSFTYKTSELTMEYEPCK